MTQLPEPLVPLLKRILAAQTNVAAPRGAPGEGFFDERNEAIDAFAKKINEMLANATISGSVIQK